MDYTIENLLLVSEKNKEGQDVLKVYADRIYAIQRNKEGKEEQKNA